MQDVQDILKKVKNINLEDKDYEFDDEEPEGTGVNFEVGQSH